MRRRDRISALVTGYENAMAIVSFQSSVVRGYVGNSAALPLLHRLGHDVWPINTVTFSNHPAHGAYTGRIVPPDEITDLTAGLAASWRDCDAVLSGYLGRADTGPVVLETVAAVKSANPNALYCCDPVIGDNGAPYVADGIAEFFRDHALPVADMVTPNAYEAEWLTGRPLQSPLQARDAAVALQSMGPEIIVITGLQWDGAITTIAADLEGVWAVATPALDIPSHGAGDAFAALFLGFYLLSRNTPNALTRAASGLHSILQATQTAGGVGDLRLIPTLDEILAPSEIFSAEPIG